MRGTISKVILILGATAVIGGAAHAAPPAATYVAKAGAGDMYEMKSSKLVIASKNAGIKSFAKAMIKDHTDSTTKVKAAAMQSGMHPKPPVLDAKQKSDIAALTAAHGAKRDALYVSQQKASHQDALALHQDYAASGDKPALKSTAGDIVPVVQHHIEMLNGMPSS